MECNYHQDNRTVAITFSEGNSEPLILDFNKGNIDGFCKWNGKDPKEFYSIFDLFIEMKPLFSSLKISDDEGLWEEYIIRKKPCKVQLKPLVSDKEKLLLNRAIANSFTEYNEAELTVLAATGLSPSAPAICRLIIQDFIEILNIKSRDDFDPEAIVALTNELAFADDHLGKAQIRIFNYTFSSMMLQIWISYAFAYKNQGVVRKLSNETRGLKSSKLAALFGVKSIFLNEHSGVVNGKHAEMKKFAAQYYPAGELGEVMVHGNEDTVVEFLVSMVDYLHFNYIGIN
jgi:hypothetical protein